MSSPTSTLIRTMTVGLALFGATMARAEEPWRVARASGDVWKLSDGAPSKVQAGSMVTVGESVRTGANGRLLLSRGVESMLLGANTALDLAPGTRSGMTTIFQKAGTLALDIEHQGEPHFEVETPYLVAAVKGTRFEVKVQPRGADVAVSRGLVQVSSLKSGEAVGVAPGQRARVSAAAAGVSLAGPGPHAAVEQIAPRLARVEPIAVSKRGLASPLPKRRPQAAALRPAQHAQPSSGGRSGSPKTSAAPASAQGEAGGTGHRQTIWSRGEVVRQRAAAPDGPVGFKPE